MSGLLKWLSALLLVAAAHAHAGAPLVLNLTDLIKGPAPHGTSPYVTATFEDVSSGVVRLTISTSGLAASDSLKQMLFNYNGALSALKFTNVSGEVATIKTGSDRFSAGGHGGKFDIQFGYPTGKKDNLFTGRETSVYDIRAAGATAQSFSVKSAPQGHKPTFYAAGQIALKGQDSWIGASVAAVPEPESYALMAAGLGVLLVAARRRKDSSK